MSTQKSDLVLKILEDLKSFPFKERVEILANVLVQLALLAMESKAPGCLPESIDHSNLLNAVVEYKKKYGETVEGALGAQALTMLLWLEK